MYQNPFTKLRRPMLEGADQNAVGPDITTMDSRLAGSRRLPRGAAQAIMMQRRNRDLSKPIRPQPGVPNDLSKPVRYPVKGNENLTNPVIRPGAPPIVPKDFATQPANDLLSVGDRMQPVNDMDSGYLRTGISDRARQVRNPILAARRQFNRMD